MLIAQLIELKPTSVQTEMFYRHSAGARIARNDLVALWRAEGKKEPDDRLDYRKLRPRYNALKHGVRPWFSELSQNAIKGGLMDAEDAVMWFYRKLARPPRFHKAGRRDAFRADNGVGTVSLADRTLRLPKKAGGNVRMKEALRWPGAVIRGCRIRRKADRWFASVRVEVPDSAYPQRCGQGRVGLDLGLSTFATIAPEGAEEADVVKVSAPQPFRTAMTRLRRAQRRVSRRKIGSNNRRKAKRQVEKLHYRIDNIRKDFLHQLSHRLTAEYAEVKVETLSVQGWKKLHGRKTSDLAPAELLRQLDYKATWRGGRIVAADMWFPSSRLCHNCGWKYQDLTLNERAWTCKQCGVLHDRDANAALNIRDYRPELPGDCLWTPCKTTVPVAAAGEAGTVAYALASESG